MAGVCEVQAVDEMVLCTDKLKAYLAHTRDCALSLAVDRSCC